MLRIEGQINLSGVFCPFPEVVNLVRVPFLVSELAMLGVGFAGDKPVCLLKLSGKIVDVCTWERFTEDGLFAAVLDDE